MCDFTYKFIKSVITFLTQFIYCIFYGYSSKLWRLERQQCTPKGANWCPDSTSNNNVLHKKDVSKKIYEKMFFFDSRQKTNTHNHLNLYKIVIYSVNYDTILHLRKIHHVYNYFK